MRYSRGMGYGFYGSYILSALVIFIMISLIAYLIYSKKKKTYFQKDIEILKQRYVREEISSREFREKMGVIEGLKVSGLAVVLLVERYAKGEIDSEKFFIFLEQIEK